MPREVRQFGVAAIVAAGLALPASAEAVTVGPDVDAAPSNTQGCSVDCTLANVVLPGAVGLERSPITGTITRWRGSFGSGDGPVRLQVLKRTHNESGTANDEFVAVRETVDTPIEGTAHEEFDAHLKIRKGQFIGLVLDGGSGTSINLAEVGPMSTSDFIDFEPPLAPGDSPRKTNNVFTGSTNQYLLYNARVRR